MTREGDLAYAWARICARLGERPDEVAWRSIELIRDLPAMLDAARGPAFRRWLVGVTPDAGPHAIEAVLLARWRGLVREVAQWMPGEWQPAVEWAGALAELPALQHLAREGDVLPWMQEDPLYRELVGPDPVSALDRLRPLAAAWSDPDGMLSAWRAEWGRRIPRGAFVDSVLLAALEHALARHRVAVGPASFADGMGLLRGLADSGLHLFRRAALEPAAAFIFLALSALDLERLRGELLRRAIFPSLSLAA